MTSFVDSVYVANGATTGHLGYPVSDKVTGRPDGGWIQLFERGAITDSASTSTQLVWGVRWPVWQREGREGGRLGYPIAAKQDLPGGAWIQRFQKGAITDSTATTTQSVWGVVWTAWQQAGRETGVLGFPTGPLQNLAGGAWIQLFQKGAITDSTATTTQVVAGVIYTAWAKSGRGTGPLLYPTRPARRAAGARRRRSSAVRSGR